MSKRTMMTLLVAALAAVGLVLWMRHRRAGGVPAAGIPTTTVTPTELAPQAVVARSFSDLLQVGANWAAQWFSTKVAAPQQAAVPYKPPPITSKPATPATPAANTPNVQTIPTTYYA
jgi:hypothetical protein